MKSPFALLYAMSQASSPHSGPLVSVMSWYIRWVWGPLTSSAASRRPSVGCPVIGRLIDPWSTSIPSKKSNSVSPGAMVCPWNRIPQVPSSGGPSLLSSSVQPV